MTVKRKELDIVVMFSFFGGSQCLNKRSLLALGAVSNIFGAITVAADQMNQCHYDMPKMHVRQFETGHQTIALGMHGPWLGIGSFDNLERPECRLKQGDAP